MKWFTRHDTVNKNMKELGGDRSSWQEMARNRDGWRRLIRPTGEQSMPSRQTAMIMMLTAANDADDAVAAYAVDNLKRKIEKHIFT